MPNMPKVTNRILGIQVTRNLYYALKHEAKTRKMTLSEFCRFVLNEEILRLGTKLTEEEKNIIRKEIQDAIERRSH